MPPNPWKLVRSAKIHTVTPTGSRATIAEELGKRFIVLGETHPSTFELSQHGRPPLNSATGHCADHHIMRPVPKNRCPSCRNEGNWFEGKYGPFCSHRCKLIDLGKWLNEEARISEPLRPEHLEHFADLPPGQHLDQPESDPASQQ